MSSARERFLKVAHFESTDVVLPSEWQWFFEGTLDRWKKEGLPPDVQVSGYHGPSEYFWFCFQ